MPFPRHRYHLLALAAALLPLTPRPLRAAPPASPAASHAIVWGAIGHRLVSRIAYLRLTPKTRAAIRQLLGRESFSDASLWADRVRPDRQETAPLHYVNVPISAERYDSATHCPGGRCVIAAIHRYRAILADTTRPRNDRLEALRFVLHFVGDMHQPLHVGDRDDRGGNDVKLRFFDRESNLHAVWDSGLLEVAGTSENAYLRSLLARMREMNLGKLERGTVVDWAMDSHRMARDSIYATLPAELDLAEAYFDANTALVDEQIIKGGVRLARLLNDTLDR